MSPDGTGLLAGLRVLDIGHYISGPFCTKLMAGLGASVIKVEPPWGDPSRNEGPFPDDLPDSEKSGLFAYLNTSKQGVTLNLKSGRGRDLLLSLIERVDVVVENFEPRVLPSLSLDYESMRAAKPDIVLTSISNFGQTGPYRDYKSDEIGIQAVSGLMHMAGEGDKAPLKKGGSFSQYLGAANAFSATMAALFQHEITGEGAHVDLSLAESFASIHGRGVKVLSYTGEMLPRVGSNARPFPSGAYPCADGYVVLQGTMGRDWWPNFVNMVGSPELADPRFADARVRRGAADEMEVYFLPWLATKTKAEVMRLAQKHRIASGMVASATDLLESPQLASRDYFREVDFADGKLTLPGLPYVLTGVDLPPILPAPKLGQDNESVYGELGLTSEDLTKLKAEGVI